MDLEDVASTGQPGAARRSGYIGFIDWLNRSLTPAFVSAPGPADAVVQQVGEATCPVCGRPMADHVIDHSTPETLLICPANPLPRPDELPLNELGMAKRRTEE